MAITDKAAEATAAAVRAIIMETTEIIITAIMVTIIRTIKMAR